MQLWNNSPFLKTWKFSSAILANWINPTTVALLTAVMHDGISLWGPKDIFFGNKRSECKKRSFYRRWSSLGLINPKFAGDRRHSWIAQIVKCPIVPASWQSWAIHQGCHWWFWLFRRWVSRVGATPMIIDGHFFNVISVVDPFSSLSVLVPLMMIYYLALTQLKNSTFPLSHLGFYAFLSSFRGAILHFMTPPPKNPQTFFCHHFPLTLWPLWIQLTKIGL